MTSDGSFDVSNIKRSIGLLHIPDRGISQWWRELFRCRIDLLNFSMGFNIIAPYMEFLHLNWCIAEWSCHLCLAHRLLTPMATFQKGEIFILSPWIFNLCNLSCTLPVKRKVSSESLQIDAGIVEEFRSGYENLVRNVRFADQFMSPYLVTAHCKYMFPDL